MDRPAALYRAVLRIWKEAMYIDVPVMCTVTISDCPGLIAKNGTYDHTSDLPGDGAKAGGATPTTDIFIQT